MKVSAIVGGALSGAILTLSLSLSQCQPTKQAPLLCANTTYGIGGGGGTWHRINSVEVHAFDPRWDDDLSKCGRSIEFECWEIAPDSELDAPAKCKLKVERGVD